MSELEILKTKRICKDCGKPMPRAISRHYCPLKRRCKKCGKPIPKGNNKSYCSSDCYRPEVTYTCQTCSKQFRGKPHEQPKFCSRACYETKRTASIEHTCEACGARFYRPNCAGREYRFCSKRCTGKGQERKVRLACSHCKTTIVRQPAIAKAKKPYCSRKCHVDAHGMIAVSCKHCGVDFMAHRYNVNAGRSRFCSRHCKRMFAGETGIEQQVREALDSLSIAYIQEHPIQHNEKLKRGANFYFIDFFLPDHSIALEADGIYWHRSRQDSDAKRDLFLASKGIIVIRLTDKEIESAVSISDLLIQRIPNLLTTLR